MASFDLSNLADRLSQVISQNTNIASVFGKNDRAVRELFSNLSNGETILAKVLSVSESSFQISTLDNLIINAKAEKGVELTPGSTVLLEVNKSGENKVSLRPLYLNTNYEETAKSALDQAGISDNPRALELVARSMEYGNPIDRNSLLLAYKDVITFEDVPVKYLVDLKQMGLEVNRENIEGFKSFMDMKNLVTDSFIDISEGLVKDLSESILSVKGDVLPEQSSVLSNGLSMQNFENTMKPLDGLIKLSDNLSYPKENILDYSKSEIEGVIAKLNDYGIDTEQSNKLLLTEQNVSSNEVLKNVLYDIKNTVLKPFESNLELANTTFEKPQFADLVNDDQFKNLFVRTVMSTWTINEADINKKEIKDLYNRLYEQSRNISDILTASLGKESNAVNMVNNLSRNLDFMEQLNQYIPYVQIPLNSENGMHTGELYVYRNKKKLTERDSELTAFLHLDMENLGPTDVYVSLKYNNVTTNFKMASDEALQLINDNISFLDKRLSDKGYSLKCEMVVKDKEQSPLQEMLSVSEDHLIVSKTSFDARV